MFQHFVPTRIIKFPSIPTILRIPIVSKAQEKLKINEPCLDLTSLFASLHTKSVLCNEFHSWQYFAYTATSVLCSNSTHHYASPSVAYFDDCKTSDHFNAPSQAVRFDYTYCISPTTQRIATTIRLWTLTYSHDMCRTLHRIAFACVFLVPSAMPYPTGILWFTYTQLILRLALLYDYSHVFSQYNISHHYINLWPLAIVVTSLYLYLHTRHIFHLLSKIILVTVTFVYAFIKYSLVSILAFCVV